MKPIPYLHGLTLGDTTLAYHPEIHAYRVVVKTTHPSMERVFIEAFQPYSIDGIIRKYPVKGGAVPYEWEIYTWIPEKLGQILSSKDVNYLEKTYRDPEAFANLLAGLFDSDGTISINVVKRKRLKYKPLVEFKLALINTNRSLLEYIRCAIINHFNIFMNINENKSNRKRDRIKGTKIVWELVTKKQHYIKEIIKILIQRIAHEERLKKMQLAYQILENKITNINTIEMIRKNIGQEIRNAIKQYILEAERSYERMVKYLILPDGSIVEKPIVRPKRKV